MQQTIDRSQRKLDALHLAVHIYVALFGSALVALSIASLWNTMRTGEWLGVIFLVLFGIAGYVMMRLSGTYLGKEMGSAIARWATRRAERKTLALRSALGLTARPAVHSFVRVLEPTWTPYGMLFPHDIGTVTELPLDDDDLVCVRWRNGEGIHEYRHLAAETFG